MTAVEWLIQEHFGGIENCTPDFRNKIEQAKEQITRQPYKLPTVHVRDGIFCSSNNDVILENYEAHPTIKAPLSN